MGQFNGLDENLKIAFDTEFFQPILFPSVPAILLEHDHLGKLGDCFV